MKQSASKNSFNDSDRWHWHRRTLLRLRDILAREQNDVDTSLRTPSDQGGEDLVDSANGEAMREVLLAEHAAHETALAEIDAALGRISAGTYGICEATGLPIGAARLQALPWARFALEGALRHEKARRPEKRQSQS